MQTIKRFLKETEVGKHNDVPDDKFDKKQLLRGTEVEKEHTDNPEISKNIAKDHLAEIPDYYTRLDKMERDAGITEFLINERIIEADDEQLNNLKVSSNRIQKNNQTDIGRDYETDQDIEKKENNEENDKLKKALKNITDSIGLKY